MVVQPKDKGNGNAKTRHRAALRQAHKQRRWTATCIFFSKVFQAVYDIPTAFGGYVRKIVDGSVENTAAGTKELMPLARAHVDTITFHHHIPECQREMICKLVNLSVAAVNYLHRGGRAQRIPRRASRLHLSVHSRFASKWACLIRQVGREINVVDVEDAFGFAVRGGQVPSVPLVARKVDIAEKCGMVDGMESLPTTAQNVINDPNKLFPDGLDNLPEWVPYTGHQRAEYVLLVRKQLRHKLLALTTSPKHSAHTFVLPKSSSTQLRELWNGSELSAKATPPPKPPFLANPAALTVLESSLDQPVHLNGRDAQSWFHQLKSPESLTPFLGRPWVKVRELVEWELHGEHEDGQYKLTHDELQSYLWPGSSDDLSADTKLAPVSLALPMGFSWSPLVAQSEMIDAVQAAGFSTAQFLAEERRLPAAGCDVLTVATDDNLLFRRCSVAEARELLCPPFQPLDEVWEVRGIKKKESKSVDMALNGTGLGIDLVDGVALAPHGGKLARLLAAFVDLANQTRVSPASMGRYMGKWQWIMLLNRPTLSCLHAVYAFIGEGLDTEPKVVPNAVRTEIGMCVCLAASLVVDLTRPWLPQVLATDGAPSFGYGVCSARCSPEVSRSIAAHAGNASHQVLLADSPHDLSENIDAPVYRAPLGWGDFDVLVSEPCRRASSAMGAEAGALVTAVKRLARRRRHYGMRVTVLMDACSLLWGVRKGRSSAPILGYYLKVLSSLLIAMDIKLHPAYIPTSCNPADPPSRGYRRRSADRVLKRTTKRSNLEDWLHRLKRSERRLIKTGMLSRSGSIRTYDSTNSSSMAAQIEED